MPDVTIGHVQSSSRPCSPVGMVSLNSSVEITENATKPIIFYNRKYKAKRETKLAEGLLARKVFSIPPGVLPLIGGPCTVPGGSSGLFSEFEPYGMPVVSLECPNDADVFSPTPETTLAVVRWLESGKAVAQTTPEDAHVLVSSNI
jgi:hypothetical protein